MGIAKLQDTLEENKIRWFGHVMRIGKERLPKMAIKRKIRKKKPVGIPGTMWEDQVKRYVEKLGRPRKMEDAILNLIPQPQTQEKMMMKLVTYLHHFPILSPCHE